MTEDFQKKIIEEKSKKLSDDLYNDNLDFSKRDLKYRKTLMTISEYWEWSKLTIFFSIRICPFLYTIKYLFFGDKRVEKLIEAFTNNENNISQALYVILILGIIYLAKKK